jgi:hypothetical protein
MKMHAGQVSVNIGKRSINIIDDARPGKDHILPTIMVPPLDMLRAQPDVGSHINRDNN